jgi:UDP-glucose 4-epimerase
MARCLVTGGCGFIGSHLVESLVADGHCVAVLDDLCTGRLENLQAVANQVAFYEGSVTDADLVGRAVQGRDWIFHLAALPSVQRSLDDPETTHTVCATGTLRILESARRAGVGRVVYAASSSAYGDSPSEVRREEDRVYPLSPYAAAKLVGEHYCCAFTRTYGLPTVRLRLFNIFGPRQDAQSPYAAAIPRFLTALGQGRPPVIYGDGRQSRDFTYVANAVQAFRKAAESSAAVGNVYNIGTGTRTSVLNLIDHLNELLGSAIQPIHQPPRAGEVLHSQADITRAQTDLGYQPEVSFREGLRQMVESLGGKKTLCSQETG